MIVPLPGVRRIVLSWMGDYDFSQWKRLVRAAP
jgi:hypothetical protein